MSISNAAGVLKYCEQKDLVSDASTESVLDAIPKKPSATSADYVAGMSGQVFGDAGRNVLIGQFPGYLQSAMCDMVLQHAKTFVPAR